MRERRRQTLLWRLERVAAVERISTLRKLAEARGEAERSATLAERSRALAGNDPERASAVSGETLLSLMRFSGAMGRIAEQASEMNTHAVERIAVTSRDLMHIDRKIERIAERRLRLRKQLGSALLNRAETASAQSLARKLRRFPGQPETRGEGDL